MLMLLGMTPAGTATTVLEDQGYLGLSLTDDDGGHTVGVGKELDPFRLVNTENCDTAMVCVHLKNYGSADVTGMSVYACGNPDPDDDPCWLFWAEAEHSSWTGTATSLMRGTLTGRSSNTDYGATDTCRTGFGGGGICETSLQGTGFHGRPMNHCWNVEALTTDVGGAARDTGRSHCK